MSSLEKPDRPHRSSKHPSSSSRPPSSSSSSALDKGRLKPARENKSFRNKGEAKQQLKDGNVVLPAEEGEEKPLPPLAEKALVALGGVMQVLEDTGSALGSVMGALGLNLPALPCAKHFDPSLGVDIHLFPTTPSPIPLPAPYVAMVFDLPEYLAEAAKLLPAGKLNSLATMMGGSVYINGRHKGFASSEMKNLIHSPWFSPGPHNDGEVFMGSATVLAEGEPLSHLSLPGLDCNQVGLMAPFRTGKPKKTVSMVLPTSMVLAPPEIKPVLVGGPPTISMTALAMKGLMKGFGALGKKFKAFQKSSVFWEKISKKCHDGADKVLDKLNVSKKFREGVHDKICTLTGHPIDVVAGYVTTGQQTDITLPGPMPFIWQRNYYSNSTYQGQLGYGWYHNYDYHVIDNGSEYLFIRLPDGRAAGTLRPTLERPSLMPDIQMQLCVNSQGHYYLQDYHGLQYYFNSHCSIQHGIRQYPIAFIQDVHNNTIHFHYNTENGRLTGITDSARRYLQVDSDSEGRITAIHLGHQPLVRYQYHQSDLVAVFNEVNKPFEYHYQNHLLVKEVNRVGTAFYFKWDDVSLGIKARAIATWGLSQHSGKPFYVRHLRYDDQARTTTVTDGRKTTMVYHWHATLPVVSEQVDPLGHCTRFEYDAHHNISAVIDELGQRTESQYDEANRLISQTDAMGSTTHYRYEPWQPNTLMHARVEHIQRGEFVTTLQYNAQGDVIGQHSETQETAFEYHSNGQLLSVFDKRRGLALFRGQYDEQGLLQTEWDSDQQATHYHYDLKGLVTHIESDCFGASYFRYDQRGNLIERQQAAQAKEHFQYNADNQLIRYQDAAGDITSLEYKGMPFVCTRTHADSHTLKYEYDSELNLVGLVNENNERFQLHYDEKERLIKEVAFDGSTVAYQYAPNDFVSKVQHGAQAWQQHVRDPLGRLTQVRYQDGNRAEFHYDDFGRLTKAKNSQHTTEFEYDEQHQLSAQIQDGQRLEYDTGTSHHRLTLPNGQTITYHSGDNHKLSHISVGEHVLSHYHYNEKGFEVKQQLGAMALLQEYDPYGRLIEQRGQRPDEQRAMARRGYAYDKAGRVAQIQRQYGGLQQYHYDNRGRLATYVSGGEPHHYQFDAANNLVHHAKPASSIPAVYTLHYNTGKNDGAEPVYVKHNRLTRNQDKHYHYDEQGNRTLESYGNGTVQTRYFYNSQNQLTLIQSSVAKHTTQVMNFSYDALGRRCGKYVTRYQNNRAKSQTRTAFLWDGDVLLAEQSTVIDLDSDKPVPKVSFDKPDAIYIHRPNSFEPLMQLRQPLDSELPKEEWLPKPTYSVYYYLNDHLGTPQELLNKHGELVWQANTSPYGAILKLGTNLIHNPIRLPGQYEDSETGLYYNRFRYYNPSDGSYINQDPIGLAGGLNLYNYPRDPVNFFDPLGLSSCGPSDVTKRGAFPKTADEMSSLIGPPKKVGTTPDGTVRTTWTPNSSTKIRHESHPHGLKPGDAGYNPRHHGEHFHVETKPHNMSWSQARKQGQILKSKPEGYTPGSGTGFLSGENFPGY